MKKRYLAGMLCLAISLTMLFTACASQGTGATTSTEDPTSQSGMESSDSSSSTPAEDPSSQDDVEPTDPSSATPTEDQTTKGGVESQNTSSSTPAEGELVFDPGTWLSDAGQYYFFDTDGASGRTASLEDGTGVGFSYTLEGTQATFHMGAADNSSVCTVTLNGDAATLEWEDGTTEHLTYVSNQGSDSFQFYSNQELADMALTYYKDTNYAQGNENLTSAAQTNDDGSVTIQVYENLGDHNSTAAWYTVNRLTGAGTDADGAEVNLG